MVILFKKDINEFSKETKSNADYKTELDKNFKDKTNNFKK
jgi:hypothetical protein